MLGGPKACSPGKILIKTVLSGAMWASQTVITNRKTNNFRVTKSTTTKHNRHMFHSDLFFRCACYVKINTFTIDKGVWGGVFPL